MSRPASPPVIGRRALLIGGLGAALAPGLGHAETSPEAYVGAWGAAMRVPGGALRLAVRIALDDAGGLAAEMRSLDQGGVPIRATQVSPEPERITIIFASIGAMARVALSEDGQSLQGEWIQGCPRPIRFQRDPEMATLAPPPAAPLSEEALERLREQAGSPALIAARRASGRAMEGVVVGRRSVDSPTAATLEDQWHIGSITKSMTATLIALAVEAGVLSWEETLGDALAGLAPEMPAPYRDATLIHLLSHRSGLPDNLPIPRLLAFPKEEDDPRETRRAYLREAVAAEPIGGLGERHLYSNSGYVLAAMMLEERLDAPWESLIRERLFEPLGLEGAGFGAPGAAKVSGAPPEQPVGHAAAALTAVGFGERRVAYPPGSERTDNPAVLGPAGRVHLPMTSLLRFLEAHRTEDTILGRDSWRRLHTPAFDDDYALGWRVLEDGSLWHNGSNTLWYAEALVDRARNVSAAAAANDGMLVCSGAAVVEALASARAL